MTTTYHIHVNELSMELLNSIKTAFKDKTGNIIVTDGVDASDNESLRKYLADDDSFQFWMAKEEDLYEDYKRKRYS